MNRAGHLWVKPGHDENESFQFVSESLRMLAAF